MGMNDGVYILIVGGVAGLVDELRIEFPEVQFLDNGLDIAPFPDAKKLLCFVDWLLPDKSGLEYCRQLKLTDTGRRCHATLVLESADGISQRRAIEAGADDYIIGTMDRKTLSRRIALALSYGADDASLHKYVQGRLIVDAASFRAHYAEKPLALGPTEFRLLMYFAANPDRVISRNKLIQIVGKDAGAVDDNTVNVWVGRLRKALNKAGAPDFIRTVRSVGYVFDRP
jgi:two-component system phosphate regulon response regulator PhoB